MAFPRSYSDSALSAGVQCDANPGADSSKFRSLLIKISKGLGENDMEKLKYLCQDLGVAHCSFEKMTRGTHLFRELEKLELIKADDISLLVVLMQTINRYDLVTNVKSWSSKEGNLAHRLSAYRSLMLQISDSLSQDERDQFTFYLSGDDSPLPVAAIEECKSLLQLFVLMEKKTLIGPGDLDYFTNIMQSIGNIAIVKEIEKYLAIERSSVHNIQPSSSQRFQPHQGGRVVYNTGTQSNMRRDSAPTFEGYTQNPPWDGQDYQGKPPSQQQQPYHNYPPQQYHQPQQQATPLFSQQNPQQLQHGQHHVQPSSSQSYQFQQGGGVTYNTESQQSSTLTNEGHMIEPAGTATATATVVNTVAGHMPDLPRYKMDRLPRGMCIIFNAENFKVKKLKKRVGTQKDVEALLNTFQYNLKFETQIKKDPTSDEYVDCLKEITKMDHSKFDCFVCVILSHGSQGKVYGTDGELMAIDALTGLFRGQYVRSLIGKPKLFFIQACQGKHPQKAVKFHQDGFDTLPNESDILVSMSTVPGYASHRSVSHGTLFIISLCDIINKYYKTEDLLSMLTMVNELMSEETKKEMWKQIGNHSTILRKKVFFNQGLDEETFALEAYNH